MSSNRWIKFGSLHLNIALVITTMCLLLGCNPATIYTAPDFVVYKIDHRNVAIMPFDVTIDPTNKSKNVSEEELEDLETEQSETFQRSLYTQFLQHQQRGKYTIVFQDIDKTNAMLKRAMNSIGETRDFGSYSKDEVCEILDVDAIVSGKMSLSKPMGTAGAIALAFIGIGGATNESHINMTIHEREEGKLLWSYDYGVQGGLLSSSDQLAKALVTGVADSFPYRLR